MMAEEPDIDVDPIVAEYSTNQLSTLGLSVNRR
jgi:hypothetical protein